jgi:hypothetical protein
MYINKCPVGPLIYTHFSLRYSKDATLLSLRSPFSLLFGSPKGNRTPIPTVRGWCPEPLDDGTVVGNE